MASSAVKRFEVSLLQTIEAHFFAFFSSFFSAFFSSFFVGLDMVAPRCLYLLSEFWSLLEITLEQFLLGCFKASYAGSGLGFKV